MRFHEFLADGESQTEAIDGTRAGEPVKLLKDSIDISFRHASPPVDYQYFQPTFGNPAAKVDWLIG